jgi:hypothetical protein
LKEDVLMLRDRLDVHRTRDVVSELFYDIQRAMTTGVPCQTRLDQPLADPSVAHDPATRPDWLDIVTGTGANR